MFSLTVLIAIAALSLAAGALLASVWERSRTGLRVEQAKSELAVELASAKERAGRVPVLEEQIAHLGSAEQVTRSELMRISKSEGEKQQQLHAVGELLADTKRRLEATERESFERAAQLATANERRAALASELQAEHEALNLARSELEQARFQVQAALQANLQMQIEKTDIAARLEAERKQASEKLQLLSEARQSLSNEFKSLANEILEEKSRRFTEQNQTNLGQLLDPLKTKLSEFQAKVEHVYVNDTRERSALHEQVKQLMSLNQVLSEDAKSLTQALKGSSKTQGTWGELVLERLLESSGLRKGEEYEIQASHTREDGSRAQPDVVVRLPEDRNLIVDAKVTLVAYEEFASCEGDEARAAALQRHLTSVRTHIKGLSDRNYQDLYRLKSLDFVLMFIPIEPAFMLAVTHDRDLFMEAWSRNVLLVSPSTLMFVVRTVAHLWRQEAQNRNAQEIAKRGAELYDRLCAFVADLEKVGERLRQAQESYADARGKLSTNKGNVIRQAEMLRQLGVKPTKVLPTKMIEAAIEPSAVEGELEAEVLDCKAAE